MSFKEALPVLSGDNFKNVAWICVSAGKQKISARKQLNKFSFLHW